MLSRRQLSSVSFPRPLDLDLPQIAELDQGQLCLDNSEPRRHVASPEPSNQFAPSRRVANQSVSDSDSGSSALSTPCS